MTLHLIAEEIHRELGEPSSPTESIIRFWLSANIGQLNNRIDSEYTIIENGIDYESSPELGDNEKSILKLMYFIYYYDFIISSNLGAASFDSILEVTSDGATVRKANKNEIAKTYAQLKKLAMEQLDKLVNGYKSGSFKALQVVGDDTVSAISRPNDEFNRI
jgi:hypothetical protein